MKIIYYFNWLVYSITMIAYLSIYYAMYGMYMQVLLGFVQIITAIILLFFTDSFSSRINTLLGSYWILSISILAFYVISSVTPGKSILANDVMQNHFSLLHPNVHCLLFFKNPISNSKTMKTLEHHTLIYDKDCPLCSVYTSGFIKAKMLDNNGRKPYSEICKQETTYIDMDRASNEIALVDTKNKTVIYGIDSLLKVIGFRFPYIEKVGHSPFIGGFLKQLYAFISYNRKVIIPNRTTLQAENQCVPSFNSRYRIAYIIFSTIVTIFSLFYFSKTLSLIPETSIWRECWITIGQILLQACLIYKLDHKTIINYIGNLMTVSLIGSFLLVPLIILNRYMEISEHIILTWFGTTAFLMFMEHSRRVKLLQLPGYLSYTWVIYRLLILLTFLI